MKYKYKVGDLVRWTKPMDGEYHFYTTGTIVSRRRWHTGQNLYCVRWDKHLEEPVGKYWHMFEDCIKKFEEKPDLEYESLLV